MRGGPIGCFIWMLFSMSPDAAPQFHHVSWQHDSDGVVHRVRTTVRQDAVIGVLMSYPEYRSRRTDVARCVPRGTPETRLDRGPTAFFNSPIGRAICHRRNQVVRHSTQVGRKYRRPRRKHFRAKLPSKEALVRFRASSILRTTFLTPGARKIRCCD